MSLVESKSREDFVTSAHVEDLKFRLMAADLLRSAKKLYAYRQLSEKTSLPATVLSRYVKGHVLPSSERARQLWRALSKIVGLETHIRKRTKFDDKGYFDNATIVGDINVLRQAADYALSKFAGKRITKVLTAGVDGIPLSTMVANSLDVDLAVANSNKKTGVPSFLDESYVLYPSDFTVTLYLPKNALKRGDSVLAVDSVMKSGDVQAALINLIRKAKAELAGILIATSTPTPSPAPTMTPTPTPIPTSTPSPMPTATPTPIPQTQLVDYTMYIIIGVIAVIVIAASVWLVRRK